jgi:predicted nucleic acid-binding protein
LRDEADQLVLGTLRVAKAHYLVTGDKDLLALAELYPIVTPAVFWERHGH